MRNAYMLICTGVMGFAGLTVYAQPPSPPQTDLGSEMIQSLINRDSSNMSITDIMENVTSQLMPTEPAEQTEQTAETEVPLTVKAEISTANLPTAETLDTKRRYQPRLRINFSEFPLRSFTPAKHADGGHDPQPETAALLAVTVRIRDRLRLPQINLAVEDRTAIVSGTVATDRQRCLVESMLRFEPGIDAVQNNITVVPQEDISKL